jgi:hypothetical protein
VVVIPYIQALLVTAPYTPFISTRVDDEIDLDDRQIVIDYMDRVVKVFTTELRQVNLISQAELNCLV